jgi:hypothetical protein
MKARAVGALVVVALEPLAVIACDGQPAARGVDEPMLVRGGQFIAGDLPGTEPPDAGPDAAPLPVTSLAVTGAILASQFVVPGGDKVISGHASGLASSVGVRFADLGTGYWVVPTLGADPTFQGQRGFMFNADFSPNNPPGSHPLQFTAFDDQGHAGRKFSTPLCVLGRIPDNLHECDPMAPLPAAVITLQWDANFDVDLHVLTPDGLDVNPKTPFGVPIEAGTRPPSTAPRIDRDSLGGCVPDGLRQEDLIFQNPMPPGLYEIYADPFASCGQPAVRFKLTIYQSSGTCPACQLAPATPPVSGELLASQVTGGNSTGLFVKELRIQ